ncbi:14703_t:CDS:2, partial [Acaulospora colombiana]
MEIIYKDLRPILPDDTPKYITEFVNACWNKNSNERPSARDAYNFLDKLKNSLENDMIKDVDEEGSKEFIDCVIKYRGDDEKRKNGTPTGIKSSAVHREAHYISRTLDTISDYPKSPLRSYNFADSKQHHLKLSYDINESSPKENDKKEIQMDVDTKP